MTFLCYIAALVHFDDFWFLQRHTVVLVGSRKLLSDVVLLIVEVLQLLSEDVGQ